MDAIRVTKVEQVLCGKSGSSQYGSLHLTAHHLIFRYDDQEKEEMWVPYPLISLVLQLPHTLRGQCPLTFHTRTFETFSLSFSKEKDAIDVFESVKELTVCASVNQLYAFFYTPNPPFSITDGWTMYSPRDEYGRMGVGTRSKAWRFTDINKDYSFCPSYPSRLVVPTRISDSTLQYASKYRSKCRIPALTYLHWANYGCITRSSQPMVGIKQNRSVQDEKLVEAIFQSHHSPESRSSGTPIYGATTTNLIVDARPTANAMANTARGAGTENMDNYKDASKVYCGIDHIHAMRESLGRVVDALREADNVAASVSGNLPGEAPQMSVLDRQALRRSGWLRHISAVMEGAILIVRNVHVNSSHVLVHCSDGWDRTSQLSALAQLCLDPYYRTMRGFQTLIEKDWLSFGHRFLDRCGHLSSEKFFTSLADTAGGADAAQAFLASVQNRFVSQSHVKETSPCFHQFLECVRQVQRQFPDRFEFNERFLRNLHYHLYSCQFGTFIFNCERERRFGEEGLIPSEHTSSIWDFFNSVSELEQNRNPTYDPSLDNPASREPHADMGVLFPNTKDIRFWHELYGRSDEEMNGRIVVSLVKDGHDVVSSIEDADDDPVSFQIGSTSSLPLPPSPTLSPSPISSPEKSLNISSEGISSGLRSIWSSLPEVPRRPITNEAELSASPLSSSLRSPIAIPRSSSPSTTRTPQPNTRALSSNPADFFANSGVKSVWGKLSSNATAAFSVVQDAYDGVTRDYKPPPKVFGDNEELQGKTAELQTRDHLGEGGSSTSRGIGQARTIGSSYNPWDSVKPQRSTPALPSDNPWSTIQSSSPRQTPSAMDLFGSASLPNDPTLGRPPPRTDSTRRILKQNDQNGGVSIMAPTPTSGERVAIVPEKAPSTNTDPLGVGLL
ncbi:phosphatases II [Hygrophoropsis aurantiaca]|uniref:Phosphatases II n=1 Tax=Hygrophoropsis aurantiaca TaxID=72124 RepID=A0ACB8AL57_9AGAM|nr:phosphatases II [Hygrophoropsis aurantiaca]